MVLSALAISRMVLPPHGIDPSTRRPARREIAEGLRWLWGNTAVRTLALTIVTFNVTFGAAWSVLVLYAIERLGTNELGFGLLTSALALGGVAATGLYVRLAARVSLGNLMRAGLIIETVTHGALALTTSLPVALVIMFAFGAHAFVWGTTSRTVRQRAVPNELQGRVSSVYLIGLQGGIVVGSVLGGLIAGVWGVTAPFWFAFVGSAALVIWIWPQLPRIAHDDEDGDETAEVRRGQPLPDGDALVGFEPESVAGLGGEGLVESIDVAHHVGPELGRRVRVDGESTDGLGRSGHEGPGQRPADEKPLITGEPTVDGLAPFQTPG